MRRSGTTLIELLVVLIVLSVLLSVSVPAISALNSPKQQLRKQARVVSRLLNTARTTAIKRNMQVEVLIDPSANQVIAQEAGYTPPVSDGFDITAVNTNRFTQNVILDEGIEVFAVEATTSNEWEVATDAFDSFSGVETSAVTAVSFTALGSSTGGGIRLEKDGARLELVCDVLTGRALVSKSKRNSE
ncbi:GspH/FimT family pseudopilin [Verrucomicrobiota bacterium]